LRHLLPSLVFISLLTLPIPSVACSTASCVDNGDEMRRDFVVRITLADKPLPGANVQITGARSVSAMSSFDGTVHVSGLPPGEYWLSAEVLGISAGGECFHVNSHSSKSARRMVKYEWGDVFMPGVARIAGTLIESQPTQTGSRLWDLTHRVEAPISEASLKLQNPLTGKAYSTASDDHGDFSFGLVPNGTYALHVEGGKAPFGRSYGPTDQMVKVTNTEKRATTLVLEWSVAGGGSCGGASLQFRDVSN
jgi:hypothetical protein